MKTLIGYTAVNLNPSTGGDNVDIEAYIASYEAEVRSGKKEVQKEVKKIRKESGNPQIVVAEVWV